MKHAALAVSALLASAAWAEEPKVAVELSVVHAQTKPGTVEAGLEKMQQTLSERVRYGTLRHLDRVSIDVTATPTARELPNKKRAEIRLEALKDGVAKLRVKVPPTETTYTLARDKSLYVQAGEHDGGDLWLVLSQPK